MSSDQRLVSVVIPTFCRPRQIRCCLTALADQSLDKETFEVVVVDDGSPQPLGDLAAEFRGRLHLRLIRQSNAGPSAARNRGVAEAAAAWVAFTDDDCRPCSTWLESLVAGIQRRPGALVGGSTENGLADQLFSEASQWIVDRVYDHFNHDPENAYFFASNNLLCSRQQFLELGGFDARFSRAGAEDRDFCDRWRAAGWPLIWTRQARIVHFHHQTLAAFVDLHYRYGRGAWLYHELRRQRARGTIRDDLGFHGSLPASILRGIAKQPAIGRKLHFCAALVLWQLANGVGFFRQALAPEGRPRRTVAGAWSR